MRSLREVAKRIESRKAKLKEELESIVQQLKAMGVIKVALFGSFISGKISPRSDIDILAIMPDSKSGKDWLKAVYTQIKRKVSSDIFVFNIKEYEEEKESNFFLKEITRKGKVIYEKRAK